MSYLYLADTDIRSEQIEAIRRHLPKGWTLSEKVEDARVILTENVNVDGEMVAKAPHLRLVALLDTGSATVESSSARVKVLPNTALTGVAEHTILLMMALSRSLFDVVESTRRQAWEADRAEPILTDQRRYTYNWIGLENFGTLYRKTVGIVGMGLIGRAVAARLRSFGMHMLYTQRTRLDEETEKEMGVSYRSLDELLSESDFVTLHHRFQEGENDRHIGAIEISRMKASAYLINTARGRLVDEEALAEALRDDRIAGAALDVFRYEPLPADHPFFAIPDSKLLMTPHVAGAPITEAWETIGEELAEAIRLEFAR